MWRNYLSARQITEQLRRFIRTHEVPSNENTLATALSDAGFVLLKLKEQLMYENRYLSAFPADFISRTNNGMDLLLRTLVMLQRLHSQAPGTRLSALVNRSVASRKRKAAVAEADCLECIKLLLEKTNSWAAILDYSGNIEVILFSLNSPQLDSKCYALEISTMLVRQPSGFLQYLRSLTVSCAANRDENRLTPIIAQLKHGLHTGKLHIQVLVVRFLNVFRQQAANENYALLVQIEAENAGFSADRLERVVSEQGAVNGLDTLQRELAIWRQAYTPVTVLDARRSLAGSVRPSIFVPQHSTPNHQTSYGTNNRSSGGRLDSYDDDETDNDSWRGRNRLYELQSAQRVNSRSNATAPVERQRARREPEQRRSTLDLHQGSSRSSDRIGMVHPSEQSVVTEREPSVRAYNRSSDNLSTAASRRPNRYNRSDSMPQPVTRARSEGSMYRMVQQGNGNTSYDNQTPARRHAQFRSASVTPMESRARDQEFSGSQISNRSFERNQGNGGVGGANRRISRSVHDLARISEEGSRPSSSQEHRWIPMEPIQPVTWSDGSQMQLNMAIPQDAGVASNVRPTTPSLNRFIPPPDEDPPPRSPSVLDERVVRTLPDHNGVSVDIIERRSPGAVKMQGFSYLFPKRPVVDNLVVRNSDGSPRSPSQPSLPPPTPVSREYRQRSRTPDPHSFSYDRQSMDGQGGRGDYAASTASGSVQVRPRSTNPYDQNRNNRRLSIEQDTTSISASSTSQQHQNRNNNNVVYIPVRVQNNGQPGRRSEGTSDRRENRAEPDDVRDALSKFDWLNEYETSSRGSRF